MLRCLNRLFVIVSLLFVASYSYGQAKIYTRSVMMADFTTGTTKMVFDGNSPLEQALRAEISSRWRSSSYEFCSVSQYPSLSKDSGLYFLRLVSEDGTAFLSLSKGGKEDDSDRSRRPFEIIRVPVCPDSGFTGDEISFLGALLDIVQDFALNAMESDLSGLVGLKGGNHRDMSGKRIYLDPQLASEALIMEETDAIVPFTVCSSNGKDCYRMLVAADSHELFFYARGKVKDALECGFTKLELKSFELRHAEIVE